MRNSSTTPRSAGRYLREADKKKQERQKKRQKGLILWALVAVFLLFAIVLMVKGCSRSDDLQGTWRYDEITAYQFDGAGRGKLLLPGSEYAFSYEITDNYVRIDFDSETARDFRYQFSITGDKLTLTGGEGDETISYVMVKERK